MKDAANCASSCELQDTKVDSSNAHSTRGVFPWVHLSECRLTQALRWTCPACASGRGVRQWESVGACRGLARPAPPAARVFAHPVWQDCGLSSATAVRRSSVWPVPAAGAARGANCVLVVSTWARRLLRSLVAARRRTRPRRNVCAHSYAAGRSVPRPPAAGLAGGRASLGGSSVLRLLKVLPGTFVAGAPLRCPFASALVALRLS